jgi:16S rRNA processing protein RimM
MTPLSIGRITGFRGRGGEVTLRVASGRADRWVHLRRVLVRAETRAIEAARAYRDRLVLKFAGIDDAGAADALKGSEVSVLAEDLPRLPAGEYWAARLIGARVRQRGGNDLGVVEDLVETGGTDLLLVRDAKGRETLIPLAREIVVAVDEQAGRIEVDLPAGLRDLNGEPS